jgi:hypothetical protein
MLRQEVLHIVTVVFNPGGYERRYKLYRDFVEHLSTFDNVKVYTVELAIGRQNFEVTHRWNPRHLQIRTNHPMWYKENLINLGVLKLLPYNWKYMAWIDADITFQNPLWIEETLDTLKDEYDIVQPFQIAVDLGKRGNPISTWESFGSFNVENSTVPPGHTDYDPDPEPCPDPLPSKVTPGFAWACTRRAWETMDGLLDKCIVGSGDYHMAMALINRVQDTFHCRDLEAYNQELLEWQKRVQGLRLGFVPGTIQHHWHGDRKNRKYQQRRKIIERHKFDPQKHIRYDEFGLLKLVDEVGSMWNDFVNYFLGRKEDN